MALGSFMCTSSRSEAWLSNRMRKARRPAWRGGAGGGGQGSAWVECTGAADAAAVHAAARPRHAGVLCHSPMRPKPLRAAFCAILSRSRGGVQVYKKAQNETEI